MCWKLTRSSLPGTLLDCPSALLLMGFFLEWNLIRVGGHHFPLTAGEEILQNSLVPQGSPVALSAVCGARGQTMKSSVNSLLCLTFLIGKMGLESLMDEG